MLDRIAGFFDGLALLDLHASNDTLLTILLVILIAVALIWILGYLRRR